MMYYQHQSFSILVWVFTIVMHVMIQGWLTIGFLWFRHPTMIHQTASITTPWQLLFQIVRHPNSLHIHYSLIWMLNAQEQTNLSCLVRFRFMKKRWPMCPYRTENELTLPPYHGIEWPSNFLQCVVNFLLHVFQKNLHQCPWDINENGYSMEDL